MTDSGNADSSFLMWLLAGAVAVLALHVSLSWVRLLARETELRRQWRPALLASVTLGTGLCASIVLALAGEALSFALGYRATLAAALWLGAIGGGLLLCIGLVASQRWWSLLLCGALLGGLVLALQIGWISAVGFRPGISWRPEFVTAAAILEIVAGAAGLWLAFSELGSESSRRTLWRVGAVGLLGVGIVAGQTVLTAGLGLPAQVGSIFARELSGSVLSLVCGVLLPLVMGMMALDVALRRGSGRRRSSGGSDSFTPHKRRKRRHRMRTL